MAVPGYDIITVGGGIAASSLAIAMAGRGAKLLVLEREKQFKDRVRGEGPRGASSRGRYRCRFAKPSSDDAAAIASFFFSPPGDAGNAAGRCGKRRSGSAPWSQR